MHKGLIDLDVTAWTYQRHFRFRKEKLNDEEKVKSIAVYLAQKIRERFIENIASKGNILFYDEHGTNFLDNMVTMVISFDMIEFKE